MDQFIGGNGAGLPPWKVLSPTILVSTGIGMKFRTLLIITLLLTLAVSSVAGQGASGQAATAPWPMFMADPGHTSRSPFNTSTDPGQAVNWVPIWATGNASIVISARGTYFASSGTVLYRLSADHVRMNRNVGNDSLVGTPAVGWNGSSTTGWRRESRSCATPSRAASPTASWTAPTTSGSSTAASPATAACASAAC